MESEGRGDEEKEGRNQAAEGSWARIAMVLMWRSKAVGCIILCDAL